MKIVFRLGIFLNWLFVDVLWADRSCRGHAVYHARNGVSVRFDGYLSIHNEAISIPPFPGLTEQDIGDGDADNPTSLDRHFCAIQEWIQSSSDWDLLEEGGADFSAIEYPINPDNGEPFSFLSLPELAVDKYILNTEHLVYEVWYSGSWMIGHILFCSEELLRRTPNHNTRDIAFYSGNVEICSCSVPDISRSGREISFYLWGSLETERATAISAQIENKAEALEFFRNVENIIYRLSPVLGKPEIGFCPQPGVQANLAEFERIRYL